MNHSTVIAAENSIPAKTPVEISAQAALHVQQGTAFCEQEQWAEAYSVAQQAVQIMPTSAAAFCVMGGALRGLGRREEAKQAYQNALQLQPNFAEAHAGIGSLYEEMKEFQQAIAHYQLAVQSQQQPSEALAQPTQPTQPEAPPTNPFSTPITPYETWLAQQTLPSKALTWMKQAISLMPYCPLISLIMTANGDCQTAIDTVQSQIYPNWELHLVYCASEKAHIEQYARQDQRIKLVEYTPQVGTLAVNAALAQVSGDYVAFLGQADQLASDALYEVAWLLNQQADPYLDVDLIYTDEDQINDQQRHQEPLFKPDWSPETLLSRMYLGHFGIYRRSLLQELGGFRPEFAGSEDYDLLLRLTEKTDKVYHIPKVLYSQRAIELDDSLKSNAARKALTEALQRRGETAIVQDGEYPGLFTLRYAIPTASKVTIIIPTRDLAEILDRCLESVFSQTTYPNFEVVLIDNGSVEPDTAAVVEKWLQQERDRFRCYPLAIPFNYSTLNNYGVHITDSEYLLFLNNDTEIITPDWIEALVEQAQRPGIGAVGARLLYPDGTLQHAGVTMGVYDLAAHGHQGYPGDAQGYMGYIAATTNVAAVTGACLLCRREVFVAAGGFDEALAVSYNDVDLCLKMLRQGYRNVYVAHAKLYHHESKTRGRDRTPEKEAELERENEYIRQRWQDLLAHDPYYNPNLTRRNTDYSLQLTQTMIEVAAVMPLKSAEEHCLYSLENPSLGWQENPGLLLFKGWVIGKHFPVEAIEITCEEQEGVRLLVSAMPRQPRPDVASIYTEYSQASRSGFMLYLNLHQLPPIAHLQIQLQLNQQIIPLATVQLHCPLAKPTDVRNHAVYQLLVQQERWQEALLFCRQLAEVETENWTAHYCLANLMNRLGHTQAAIASYQQAAVLHPSDEIYCILGTLFAAQEQWQDATRVLEQAIALKENYLLYYQLGKAREKLEQWEAAIEAHQKALCLQPSYLAAAQQVSKIKMGLAESNPDDWLTRAEAWFDSNYYLRRYPDVQESGVPPFQHYLEMGWQERRNPSPLFDTDYYLRQYPEVLNSGMNPLQYYLQIGCKENHNPHYLFNAEYYQRCALAIA